MNRRRFLSLLAAPAIVRVASLMPGKPWQRDYQLAQLAFPHPCDLRPGALNWVDTTGFVIPVAPQLTATEVMIRTEEALKRIDAREAAILEGWIDDELRQLVRIIPASEFYATP